MKPEAAQEIPEVMHRVSPSHNTARNGDDMRMKYSDSHG
jgi:hypothetical protein